MKVFMKYIMLLVLSSFTSVSYAEGCSEGKLQFAFKNIPVTSALALIAEFAELQAHIDPTINISEPMNFGCTPWKQAAENITNRHNLLLVIENGIMHVTKK